MSGKILITDDNPLNIKLLAARLTREYYAVITANNGATMLEMAQTEQPDLILLDIMMPEMDGYEACRRLRTNPRTRHIPVVMVTALSDTEDRIKGLEAGAQDFLSKPIHDIALFARVRSLLRLKHVMDEWRMRQATGNHLGLSNVRLDDQVEVQQPEILLVHDDVLAAENIAQILKPLGGRVHHVLALDAAKVVAQERACDLVICSLALQKDDGLRICPELRGQEKTRHIPILLLGDQSDHERVARGLDLGANDYALQPVDPVELTTRVMNQVRYHRSYLRLRQGYEQSLSLALTDALTGSFNRRYFDSHLPRLMQRCGALSKPLSLIVADADHFKKINDNFGHAAGDHVLRELATRLVQSLRPSDFVARYGGEEFVAVLPETDLAQAEQVAARLLNAIQEKPFDLGAIGQEKVTISIGVAAMRPEETPDQLFQRADAATYQAKQAGRNCVIVSDD
jgi:two-component system, cell cycle response regulator